MKWWDKFTPQWLVRELGTVGRLPEGGLWRALGTPSDRAARKLVTGWMEQMGLDVRTDSVGNLWGRAPGTDPDLGTIVTGSHLDTVYMGGEYDGGAGVAAALAAVAALLAEHGRPRRTVEVAVMCEEEGSRFPGGYVGSRGLAGRLTEEHMQAVGVDGVSIGDALRAVGVDPVNWQLAVRDDISAFIELHIEQGSLLETRGTRLGIVDIVTGICQLQVSITGRADHAGTTRYEDRRDALAAAAGFICNLPEVAVSVCPDSRATVGRLQVKPNVSNVVPGQVTFTIDLRHSDEQLLSVLEQKVTADVHEKASGLSVQIREINRQVPVELDRSLRALAEEAAELAGVSWMHMDSGAGHDAQVLQSICPACLLFIPCRNGRSHCPQEYCEPDDLETGARVLKNMVRLLAFDKG